MTGQIPTETSRENKQMNKQKYLMTTWFELTHFNFKKKKNYEIGAFIISIL